MGQSSSCPTCEDKISESSFQNTVRGIIKGNPPYASQAYTYDVNRIKSLNDSKNLAYACLDVAYNNKAICPPKECPQDTNEQCETCDDCSRVNSELETTSQQLQTANKNLQNALDAKRSAEQAQKKAEDAQKTAEDAQKQQKMPLRTPKR